jgi:uncharacterized membrane protein
VKATTTVRKLQPDALIRTSAETAYTGNNVYNATAAGQSKSQTVANAAKATFLVQVQNDGNVAEALKLTGYGAGSSGWTVQYFDAQTGGADITASVTGSGWTTASLAAGATTVIRLEVTPSSAGAVLTKDFAITAASTLDPTKQDTVKATVSVAGRSTLLTRLWRLLARFL